MNMLANLMGGLVPDEAKLNATHDTIQECLEDVAEELKCSHKELFVMIKAKDEKFEPEFYIYKIENGVPKMVREITLKEILNIEN